MPFLLFMILMNKHKSVAHYFCSLLLRLLGENTDHILMLLPYPFLLIYQWLKASLYLAE